LQQRPKSITIHASVLASVTLIVTPNQDFDLNIFSTSREARRKHPLTLFDGLEKTGATVTETDESYVFGRMHTCSVKQDTSLKIEKMSTIKNKLKVNY
jgi:hypothetical protein